MKPPLTNPRDVCRKLPLRIPFRPEPLPPASLPRDPFPPIRKPRTYNPWEVDMTLCIAALTLWGDNPIAVLAFDQRVQTEIASADSELKYIPICPSWGALLAGPVSEARELAGLYAEYLKTVKINPGDAIDQLRRPARKMHERLSDVVTFETINMSYADFLKTGKDLLSEEMRRHVENQVAMQRIDAQLILVGCLDGKPRIFSISGGHVTESSTFAVIGSGSFIAESVLYGREQVPFQDITRTLYNVYEAMRLGRNAPGVGPCRIIMMLKPVQKNGQWEFVLGMLSPATHSILDRYFVQFGPKTVPPTLPSLRLADPGAFYSGTDESAVTSGEGQQAAKE